MQDVLEQVCALPADWHVVGSVSDDALRVIARLAPRDMAHSAETGTGRTTLLLSHLSADHVVFTINEPGLEDSTSKTRGSSLLNVDTVNFVFGRTQVTVPRYEFPTPLDLVLIDGPHGFPFPILEYYHFYPHVRPGGLLIVDDVNIPSIRFLHDFMVKDDMWHLEEIAGNTAFFRRTDAETFDPLGDTWFLQGYNRDAYEAMIHPPPPPRLLWLRAHAPEWLKRIWRCLRGRS